MRPFTALFLLAPLVELYVLIEVGAYIGAWPTVALVVATAMFGMAVLRRQGIAALRRGIDGVTTADAQTQSLIAGFLAAVASVLLIVPGFITDCVGLALLLPPVRARLAQRLMRRLVVASPSARPAPGGRIIEGEFERRP